MYIEWSEIMDEVESLKDEIKVLNKRISILEGNERRRKFFGRIKFIVKIITLAAFCYGVWYAYDYITKEIPKKIENGITDLIPNIFG